MHLTAPSYPAPEWLRSFGTGGRDPSEWVVTIAVARYDQQHEASFKVSRAEESFVMAGDI